jgi:hypothetical protein
MTKDTRERGFIMVEQVQRVIDQLQDNPDLIGMTRVTADNLDESQ